MRISEIFPSRYLKADDLGGRAVQANIRECVLEDLDGDKKPVLYFKGKEKGIVVNKTNAKTLVGLFGDESNTWAGEKVELYPARVSFKGEEVDAIRLRAVRPATEDGLDDDIPF